jgi:hypothetical protein
VVTDGVKCLPVRYGLGTFDVSYRGGWVKEAPPCEIRHGDTLPLRHTRGYICRILLREAHAFTKHTASGVGWVAHGLGGGFPLVIVR